MYPARRSAFPAAASVGQPNPFASGPTTATASIQVHYLWVAGRYRDLSSERGLGLTAEAHTLGPIPELGDSSDHSGSRPASTHLPPSGNHHHLLDRTGSSERKINPFLDIRNFAADSGANSAARSAGVHGARHGSLRSYAADRLKSQELLESRISRTTDVERLKWEAKSALLNGAHSLAVLLFVRAGALGSISSCTMLTKIYSSGITRGTSPRIVVIRRDPLRALAWDIEALRLLQRRLEPTKYGSAVYAQSSSISEAWSAEQPQGLEETFRCCELLIRLLRTSQAGLASLSAEAAAAVLPDIKTQKRLKSDPSAARGGAASRRPEVRLLWDEIGNIVRWLETRLERSVALARHRASQPDPIADPDDEFDHDEAAEYLEALAVQLAFLRAVRALRTVLTVRSKDSVRAAKERWAQSLAAASSSHCPAGMDDVVPLAEAGLAFLHALPEDGWSGDQDVKVQQAAQDLTERLEDGLMELAVPAVDDPATPEEGEGVPVKSYKEQAEKPEMGATPNTDTHEQTVRRPEKRKSLTEVPPVDMDSVTDAVRETQLNLTQRLVGASQPAVAGLIPVEARGQHHLPRAYAPPTQQGSSDYLGHGKAPSFSGLTTASFVGGRLTSPSVIGLDSGSITAPVKEPLLTPGREIEGFAFPRQRRPSSVVSDTPSLLFGASEDADKLDSREDKHESQRGLRTAADGTGPQRPALDRKRVVSMYGITPASGSKGTFAPAERVSVGFGTSANGPISTGISRTHRSPPGTSAQDALATTLRKSTSGSSSAIQPSRSLFLTTSHGRSMSGQASDHLRKLRQQDAASTHSRMNSDAMSTLSRTLNHRKVSDAGKTRPASLLLAPSASIRSLSTAPLPDSLQARTSPTLSRATAVTVSASSAQASKSRLEAASASSAIGSLRKMGRASEPGSATAFASAPSGAGEPNDASGPPSAVGHSPSGVPRPRNGKGRPAPLARAFESMDPTSRPSSGPHSPISPHAPNGSFPASPAGAGTLSPHVQRSSAMQHSRGASTSSSSSHAQQLDAALAEAEAKSRLHTEGTCSICGTRCENAPVSRTGERWCSRECRMEAKRRKGADEPGAAGGAATAEAVSLDSPASGARGATETAIA